MNLKDATVSPYGIKKSLDTLVSNIKSPHLKSLRIRIRIERLDVPEDSLRDEETIAGHDVTRFHTVLCDSVFDGLRGGGVHIEIDSCGLDNRQASKLSLMATVKRQVSSQFAPWLDRGVLVLQFYPDPDPTPPSPAQSEDAEVDCKQS
ncbi:hypothetical protein DAEQUDRAFT_727703 [Daedalea quercina L-15889]|uniref:Uncharacterized protein n=1 Tax=Daedalea quercina L-15889 TaxID=1314783 RepID=A0A165PSN5_9APHY|nr:hypothetical protein DAEQUDRAFT_727703 [Daedalea quercina L-15889]